MVLCERSSILNPDDPKRITLDTSTAQHIVLTPGSEGVITPLEDGEVFVNEINTIPGFTSHSMYPKLFEYNGTSCTELVDRLIQLAFQRFACETQLKVIKA